MAKVVHFEIPAKNPKLILKFYKDIFGWEYKEWGDDGYWITEAGPKTERGIGGGIYKSEKLDRVLNSVAVSSIKGAIEKVKQAGGRIYEDPHEIPGVGWHVYAYDPEGTMFGMVGPM